MLPPTLKYINKSFLKTRPNLKMDKGFEQTFFRRHANGNKHMRRCSTSLVIMRYYFTPTWMAIRKKMDNNKW